MAETEKKERSRRKAVLFASLFLLLLLIILVFCISRRSSNAPAEIQLLPAETAPGVQTLSVGTCWKGWLRVSNHKGEGCLADGLYPIRGRLDETEDGAAFELYEEEDRDGESPILSLYVTLDGNTIQPRIGRHDARFFDIWLDSRDVKAFTLTLENGILSQSYSYNSGQEQCRIEFRLEEEKNT